MRLDTLDMVEKGSGPQNITDRIRQKPQWGRAPLFPTIWLGGVRFPLKSSSETGLPFVVFFSMEAWGRVWVDFTHCVGLICLLGVVGYGRLLAGWLFAWLAG